MSDPTKLTDNPVTSNATPDPVWPRAAVSLMVLRDNHVLLGQRAKPPLRGVWSLPGGHIEKGETVVEAAGRELLEETGVSARVIGHAGTHDVILRDENNAVTVHYVLTVLVGTWQSGCPSPASDCLATAWVGLDALDDFALTAGTADLVRRVHAGAILPFETLDAFGKPR